MTMTNGIGREKGIGKIVLWYGPDVSEIEAAGGCRGATGK
jgi:hypothetical protein